MRQSEADIQLVASKWPLTVDSRHGEPEAAVGVALLLWGWSDNIPMLSDLAVSHPEYVCESLSGRSGAGVKRACTHI